MTEKTLERANDLKRIINYASGNYLLRVTNLDDTYIGEAVNEIARCDTKFKEDFEKLVNETHSRLVDEFNNL